METFEYNCCTVFPITVPVSNGLKSYNFYLISNNKSLTLIDAGINDNLCYEALIRVLNTNGFTLNDITEILLTHHHIDHVGLVNRIIEQHEIPIYAHPNSIPRLKRSEGFLQMRIDFYEKLYREMNCGLNGERQVHHLRKSLEKNKHLSIIADIHPLLEGDSLLGFSVIEVFGHAPDQIAFYDQKRKWLFGGDYLIHHISSNALVEPDLVGNRKLALLESIRSHQKCLELDIDTIFSGHGQIINQPKDLIRLRLERINEKSESLFQLIKKGVSTASELAQEYYNKIYNEQFVLVMSEIIGHLDLLEHRNKISKRFSDGIWIYKEKTR